MITLELGAYHFQHMNFPGKICLGILEKFGASVWFGTRYTQMTPLEFQNMIRTQIIGKELHIKLPETFFKATGALHPKYTVDLNDYDDSPVSLELAF